MKNTEYKFESTLYLLSSVVKKLQLITESTADDGQRTRLYHDLGGLTLSSRRHQQPHCLNNLITNVPLAKFSSYPSRRRSWHTCKCTRTRRSCDSRPTTVSTRSCPTVSSSLPSPGPVDGNPDTGDRAGVTCGVSCHPGDRAFFLYFFGGR